MRLRLPSLSWLPLCALAAGAQSDPSSVLRQAIAAVCANPQAGAEPPGVERRHALEGGAVLSMTRIAPGGRLRELRAVYEAPARGGTRPEFAT